MGIRSGWSKQNRVTIHFNLCIYFMTAECPRHVGLNDRLHKSREDWRSVGVCKLFVDSCVFEGTWDRDALQTTTIYSNTNYTLAAIWERTDSSLTASRNKASASSTDDAGPYRQNIVSCIEQKDRAYCDTRACTRGGCCRQAHARERASCWQHIQRCCSTCGRRITELHLAAATKLAQAQHSPPAK